MTFSTTGEDVQHQSEIIKKWKSEDRKKWKQNIQILKDDKGFENTIDICDEIHEMKSILTSGSIKGN